MIPAVSEVESYWKFYTPPRQIIEGEYSAVSFMKFNVGKHSHSQDGDRSADKAWKLSHGAKAVR